MAAVATIIKSVPLPDTERLVWGTLSFDSSYPTGGEAVALTGFERLDTVFFNSGAGYNLKWDAASQKVLAFRTDQVDDPEEQVPDTTDLSGVTGVPFIAVGS